jgi:hypothetical protein
MNLASQPQLSQIIQHLLALIQQQQQQSNSMRNTGYNQSRMQNGPQNNNRGRQNNQGRQGGYNNDRNNQGGYNQSGNASQNNRMPNQSQGMPQQPMLPV